MTDAPLVLDEFERKTELWLKVMKHYTKRLEILRQQNDQDKTTDQTAKLRGRIAECKGLLALDNPAPAIVANDE